MTVPPEALPPERRSELERSVAAYARSLARLEASLAGGERGADCELPMPPSWWDASWADWTDATAVGRALVDRMYVVVCARCRTPVCRADVWGTRLRLSYNVVRDGVVVTEDLIDLPRCPRCHVDLEFSRADLRRLSPSDEVLRAYARKRVQR